MSGSNVKLLFVLALVALHLIQIDCHFCFSRLLHFVAELVDLLCQRVESIRVKMHVFSADIDWLRLVLLESRVSELKLALEVGDLLLQRAQVCLHSHLLRLGLWRGYVDCLGWDKV
jgi:hypothetical protein